MSPPSCSAPLHWSLHTARSSANLPVHAPPMSVPVYDSLLCCPCPFLVPSSSPCLSYNCPLPQPSALLVLHASLLQTVPGQLDLLASACAVGVGCCLAAPVGGKSHFLPPLFPEYDLEGGSGWLPQLWGGKGCSPKGWVGGPSAPGLQGPTLFQQRAVCSLEAVAISCMLY